MKNVVNLEELNKRQQQFNERLILSLENLRTVTSKLAGLEELYPQKENEKEYVGLVGEIEKQLDYSNSILNSINDNIGTLAGCTFFDGVVETSK